MKQKIVLALAAYYLLINLSVTFAMDNNEDNKDKDGYFPWISRCITTRLSTEKQDHMIGLGNSPTEHQRTQDLYKQIAPKLKSCTLTFSDENKLHQLHRRILFALYHIENLFKQSDDKNNEQDLITAMKILEFNRDVLPDIYVVGLKNFIKKKTQNLDQLTSEVKQKQKK